MSRNIFHKAALQSLRHNRMQTLVTVLGVALSAALFTGIASFGTSLIRYLIDVEIAKGGEWHLVFSDADAAFTREQADDPETADILTLPNIGYARLDDVREESAEKPYLFLTSLSEEAQEQLPIHLTAGRMPENDQEILIPSHISLKAGIRFRIGDTLTLAPGERTLEGETLTQCDPYREGELLTAEQERTCIVTGIYERPGFELHEAPGYTVITGPGSQAPSGRCTVYVRLHDPRKVRSYAEAQEGGGSWAVNEGLLRFMGISENRLFNAFLLTIGSVLTVIIMTASVFLIYNSFHISLNERTRQFGILMSVGASARQLRGMVLFEGLCIGSLGIPLGTLAGIGCIRLLLPVVSGNFSAFTSSFGVPLRLSISFPVLLASAAVSLITILISAWIPARKAASTPILECIRQTNEIRIAGTKIRTPGILWRLCGLEGTLALRNFKRNKRRYRGVILSLTFSVVLIVAGSAFNTTLKRLSKSYTSEAADGDLAFVTEYMPEEEFVRLYDLLKDTEGVTRSSRQLDRVYPAATEELPEDFLTAYREGMGDDSTGPMQQIPLYTMFIEDAVYEEFLDRKGLPREAYTGPEGKVLMCAFDSTEHVVYCAGSTLHFTLSSAEGTPMTIEAAFMDDYPLGPVFDHMPDWGFIMTVPLHMQARFEKMEVLDDCTRNGMLFWTETPSQTLAKIQKIVMDQGTTADYLLYNLSAAFDLYRNLSFVIDVFTYVFVFLIALIAVANVFNTISTNIRLRRRELAMLRSVGMSDRSFQRMMNFECMFYGMRTLLYGVPLAGVLSWLIHRALTSVEKTDDLAFAFPWAAMTVSVLGVFGIVFITMVFASRRIRRENIIDALQDEMV